MKGSSYWIETARTIVSKPKEREGIWYALRLVNGSWAEVPHDSLADAEQANELAAQELAAKLNQKYLKRRGHES